ncbi:MAG: lytic murein transglycosylase, partial [Hyphomicrobiales bacterium]|nr:lytic murein transglycosylase [Hyphomicrobiales bacterium]
MPIFRACSVALAVFAILAVAPAHAVDRGAVERQFSTWVDKTLWPQAKRAGVSRKTFTRIMKPVRLDWSLPDLFPPGGKPPRDQQQSEFRQPGRYFGEGGLNALAAGGAKRLRQWKQTLDAIEKRYGVPRRIIVAIWGRESAFGNAKIPHDAVRVLATEAFMGVRKDEFLPELIAALKIYDEGALKPGEMKSSWA